MAENIASYGSTDEPGGADPAEGEVPKISGKSWGRVKNFVSGQSGFPKSVFFIIGTEFCERFSYYGMRAVLVLYLTNVLRLSDSRATALYHIFIMLCYFTPMFGAMIADGLLGKYRTILYISLIYMMGNVVMCLTALPPQTTGHPELVGPLVGLILIGFGTGGIKPCVSAFGGDQFGADQTRSLQQFFSVFYFAINAGSVLSTFLTPVFRHDVHCFEDNDCYALAFGVPAVLMFGAVCVFFAGQSFYKMIPPEGNVVWVVIKTSVHALYRRVTTKSDEPREHWLDWADDTCDARVLQDIKNLYHVLKMYALLPFFWALFDQQGSRWTLQAEHMDGNLGFYTIKPDQMQVLNPVLIILMIPLFEAVIYPFLQKMKIPTRPLARMCTGMLLGGIAFILAGLIQLRIEGSEVLLPGDEQTTVKFINTSPCPVMVDSSLFIGPISPGNDTIHLTKPIGKYYVEINPSSECQLEPAKFTVDFKSKEIASVIIYEQNSNLRTIKVSGKLEKADKGKALISIGNFAESLSGIENLNVTLESSSGNTEEVVSPFNVTDFIDVEPDRYTVYYQQLNSSGFVVKHELGNFTAGTGAIYRVLLQEDSDEVVMGVYVDVKPNSVCMLWQIPQYVVITAGEILFSITGLEFSYSQAPVSMKSCVQAAWLMTVAIGNLIIVIIAEAEFFSSQAAEFFLFAGLMGVVILLFSIMVYFYTYITPTSHKDSPMDDVTSLISRPEDEAFPPDGPIEEIPYDPDRNQGF